MAGTDTPRPRRHIILLVLGAVFSPVPMGVLLPIYDGLRSLSYLSVIIGAVLLSAWYLWDARPSFQYAFSPPTGPAWHKPKQITAIVLMTFAGFLGAGSVTFFVTIWLIT